MYNILFLVLNKAIKGRTRGLVGGGGSARPQTETGLELGSIRTIYR